MPIALINGRVLIDDAFAEDVGVVLDGARITHVEPVRRLDPSLPRYDLNGLYLAPGFIDTQVNGGGGVLFNDAPTPASIRAIGAAHRTFGTTGYLPTLISDDVEVIARAREAAGDAIREGVPGVLGVHIEGPFLNVARKGVHDPSKFRRLDDAALPLLTAPREGRTLVTLAPEMTTPELIRSLVEAGVVVAAGHTDGDHATIRRALDAGLSGFTHLFNAMSPLTSRAPGAVGAALDDQTAWCGLIVDGHHVDPVVLRIALRCRPLNRFMLVTDAMPSVGAADKNFVLQGRAITVEDGVVRGPGGVLAGSDLNMAAAVRNARDLLGLSLAEACRMASQYPAEFLGLQGQCGRITAGLRADLVLFDEQVKVKSTWISGELQTAA